MAVAETDFEEQITELSDENYRLGLKIQDMEQVMTLKVGSGWDHFKNGDCEAQHSAFADHIRRLQENENRLLEEKLNKMEVRMYDEACGVQGQLSVVAHQNSTLMHKVRRV